MSIESITSKDNRLRQLVAQRNNGEISKSEFNKQVRETGPIIDLEAIGAEILGQEIKNQKERVIHSLIWRVKKQAK